MVAVHMAQKDALDITQYIPNTCGTRGIVAERSSKLAPGTFAAVEQDATMTRDLNQRSGH